MLYLLLLQVVERPEQRLYEYGILGIGLVILCGVCYKMFKIILNDRDKAIEQRDQLLDTVFTKVLPAINDNTRLFQEITELIKENTRALSRSDHQGGR